MVSPRRFSSGRRSASTPVKARTSAVLPWSMWPAVARIMPERPSSRRRPGPTAAEAREAEWGAPAFAFAGVRHEGWESSGKLPQLVGLGDELRFVFEAAQIEDDPPGLDAADYRHRQQAKGGGQLLPGPLRTLGPRQRQAGRSP